MQLGSKNFLFICFFFRRITLLTKVMELCHSTGQLLFSDYLMTAVLLVFCATIVFLSWRLGAFTAVFAGCPSMSGKSVITSQTCLRRFIYLWVCLINMCSPCSRFARFLVIPTAMPKSIRQLREHWA